MANRKPVYFDPVNNDGWGQVDVVNDTISASGFLFKGSQDNFITLDSSNNIVLKDQVTGEKNLKEISTKTITTSVNFIEKGNFDSAIIEEYNQGQSADFNVSGSSGGVFELDDVSPLRGEKSLKYTNNATASLSDNDWISQDAVIGPAYSGSEFELRFRYKNEFQSGNIKAKLIDDSGRTLIDEDLPINTETHSLEFSKKILIHRNTSTVTWGFQVINGESSKTFTIDDVVLSPDLRETVETVLTISDDSMVRLSGGNGLGSTNTRIRRFLNLQEKLGSAITYTDSATEGASFLIEEDGIYHFSYSERSIGGTVGFGFSLNSQNLTTDLWSLPEDEVLMLEYANSTGNEANSTTSWSGYLRKGDIIRPHLGSNVIDDAEPGRIHFTATKIGGVKGFTALKDQKVEIPTSKIRYTQINSPTEGTGAEASTVWYLNAQDLYGEGLAVNNSNGTVVTVKKSGIAIITAGVYRPAVGLGRYGITLNDPDPATSSTFDQEYVLDSGLAGGTGGGQVDLTMAWSGPVSVGDVIRVKSQDTNNPAVADYINHLNVTLIETEVSVAVNNITPQYGDVDSIVRLGGQADHGSGNLIERFSSVFENVGTAITYQDDAVNGASFTINEDGYYSISYTFHKVTDSDNGISLNSSELTTNIASLTNTADRLALASMPSAERQGFCSWSGPLKSGDIVRAHGDGASPGSNPQRTAFTIARHANPSVIGIDGRPVDAYQEERDLKVRAEGNGGEAITAVTEDIPWILVSDTHSSWDGLKFTAPEDGIYEVSGSVRHAATAIARISAYINGSEYMTLVENDIQTKPFSGTIPLSEGDELSFRTGTGLTLQNVPSVHHLNVHRRGSLKRAIPLIDSTVDIPISELRMEGNNGAGSSNRIRRYTGASLIQGEAFSFVNDSTNGFVLTVLKDGVATFTVTDALSTFRRGAITRNEDPSTLTLAIDSVPVENFLVGMTVNQASGLYSASWTGKVYAGDEIRLHYFDYPGADPTNPEAPSFHALHQETEVAVALSNVTPQFEDVDSMVRVGGPYVYGSETNSRIFRFSNIYEMKGGTVEFVDDAVLGQSYKIKEAGHYNIHASAYMSGTDAGAAITLNASNTDIRCSQLPAGELLNGHYNTPTGVVSCSWSGYLKENDIIRFHAYDPDADASIHSGTRNDWNTFVIAKQALPSISEVDVTPFVDLDFGADVPKQYSESTGDFTITGTNFTTDYSSAVYYKTSNGKHRLNFNIGGDLSVAAGNVDLTFSGVTFKSVTTNSGQALSVRATVGDSTGGGRANGGSGIMTIIFNGSANSFAVSGDVELDSKPTWAEDLSLGVERVYAVEDNENVFSAKVNGLVGGVISQNITFIDSFTRESTGLYTVNYVVGFFSELPVIELTSEGSGTAQIRNAKVIGTPTLNGFQFTVTDGSHVVEDADRINITVSRQGEDYRDLQRQIVSLKDFPRVNNQLTQEISHSAASSTLLNSAGELEFNLSNITIKGDSLLSVEDDSGNTRTKFFANKDCLVDISALGSPSTVNRSMGVFKNDVLVLIGTETTSANRTSGVSGQLRLKEADFFTLAPCLPDGSISGSVASDPSDRFIFNIVTTAQELKSVGNLEGGENVFSARIDSSGNIVSQSYPFLQSVSSGGGVGIYTITFLPGFFSEIPQIVCSAEDAERCATPQTITKDGFIARYENMITGANLDGNFNMTVTRQGTDYRDPQEQIIQLENFPRVNRTIKQTLEHSATQDTFQDHTDEARFPTGLTTTSFSGPTIMTVEDDVANTRTKFVAARDCTVHFSWSASISTSTDYLRIYKNDVAIQDGNYQTTTNFGDHVSTTLVLEAGDYLTCGAASTGLRNSVSSSSLLNIVAEAQELERVDNVDAATNVYGAKVANGGAASITSQSETFIQSVNRTGTGTVDVTFVPGTFTVAPSVVVAVSNNGGNFFANAGSVTTSGFTFRSYDAGGTLSDRNVDITAIKQGADYKNPQDVVVSLYGGNLNTGQQIQTIYDEVVGPVAITSTIPADNTIPQISEGQQILSASITPNNIGNVILVEVQGNLVEDANHSDGNIFALFDGSTNAIAVGSNGNSSNTGFDGGPVSFTKRIIVGSLNTINFTVRCGCNGGNSTLNAVSHTTNLNFGNTLVTSIKVTELQG